MLTVDALKELYVKMGGQLTDTYDGIAGGIPVSEYALIPDMIEAVTQKAGSGGGGGEGGDGNPVFPIALLKGLTPATFTDNGITYYCLGVRTEQQLVKGGMDDITISDLHSQIGSMSGYNMSARFLTAAFSEHPGATTVWYNDDALLATVKVEAKTAFELWEGVSAAILAAEPESGHDSRIALANSVLSYYLKTNDFGQYLQNNLGDYITPYLPARIELKGTVITGETIADVTTIAAPNFDTFENAYNYAIADSGRGVNVWVRFVNSRDETVCGAVCVPLFVSVDNGTYTATFTFHDGTSVKKAVGTGSANDNLSFTVS